MSNNEEKKEPESPTKIDEAKENLDNPEIKVEEHNILEEVPEPKEAQNIEQKTEEEKKPKKKKKNVVEESKTEIKKVKHEAPFILN